MASSGSRETLESWLNKATDPNNEGDRWDCIQGFYQLVNEETNGPQVATRLLAHKIQSPQEKEALQALTVLEACMNNCGKRFHTEAAKFRFLNELIKILTPKYFGAWTPQQVKDRVTEVLYGWTLWLKEEPKIQQAYSMLKKQGIVKGDPKLSDTLVMPPPPQRTTESIFDQEDKAKLLTRLLKSGHPKDLETANRLIKNTIKEEQEKAEKASKRESTLKEVESCTKQLRELLDQHVVNGATFQPSNDVKALYERCDRLRPNLFRLASDTMDDDEALTQILAANDELTLTVNAYKDLVGRGSVNGRRVRNKSEEDSSRSISPTSPTATKSYHLIDLSALDSPKPHRKADLQPEFESSLFFSSVENTFFTGADEDLSEMDFDKLGTKQSQDGPKSYYTELMQLNEDIQMRNSEQNGGKGPTLRARGCGGTSAASNGTNIRSLPHTQSTSQKLLSDSSASPWKREESCCAPKSLNHIFVPLETIKSSPLEPVILYNQGGIHVSLHFASNCPPANPGVAVVVMSAVNTSALPVKDFSFQVAVPKSMSVKLQPASGTHLLPFNPLHPPSSVSQVLLLANPQSCKVRLRYKLTLTHGDKHLNEAAEIDSFPDWNSLIGC
ncbi:ADP-ribosylation factor-binding protein GGA2 isoform X1 [Oryzias latipes]|uniref:ADP-ribosylation factor-binding protein GGA2 isoform X1 n=1 Tax=Oryzias latipes TaxID=8090 RepID=UPI000CE1C1F3|nr:ADP-ribosylation factor-binding protein GGA2 isoform X1 [Oryzias latipes]